MHNHHNNPQVVVRHNTNSNNLGIPIPPPRTRPLACVSAPSPLPLARRIRLGPILAQRFLRQPAALPTPQLVGFPVPPFRPCIELQPPGDGDNSPTLRRCQQDSSQDAEAVPAEACSNAAT